LQLYGGIAYGYDDNLLRVPEGAAAFGGGRSDRWWQREAGLLFDKTYSRQRISLVAKLSRYDFDRFKQLDYNGKDLQATWFWQLGNRLQGKAGMLQEQTLASYTDLQSDQRNLRHRRARFAEGAWHFHPSWQVRAGLRRDTYNYELSAQRVNDRTEDAAEIELGYLPASGSTVGLVARRIEGRFPYPRGIGPAASGDGFTQDELKARVLWLATGSTSVDALIGYTRRDQAPHGFGRASGLMGRIHATYQPRGKVTYNAAVWRDFEPLESTDVSYTLNNGASVGARWDATAKIRIDANAARVRRQYAVGADIAGLGSVRDATRTRSLSATWSPKPTLQVKAMLAHEARSGLAVLRSAAIRSNSMTLSASAQF
jgi:exopolysaccharide biosynthesis operon protein EpsL